MNISRVKFRKIIKILVGLFISGLGTAFLFELGWGSAPTSTIIEGVSRYFNLGFGLSSFSVNLAFLLLLFIFDKSLIGLGTILAALFLGIFIDLGTFIVKALQIPDMNLYLKFLMLLIGSTLNPIGLAYYMGQLMGSGAADSMSVIVHKKLNIEFKYSRWATDFLFMLLGIILGASWGIGTIATFILSGPIMQFVFKRINFMQAK